jgi:hypothetical protein
MECGSGTVAMDPALLIKPLFTPFSDLEICLVAMSSPKSGWTYCRIVCHASAACLSQSKFEETHKNEAAGIYSALSLSPGAVQTQWVINQGKSSLGSVAGPITAMASYTVKAYAIS